MAVTLAGPGCAASEPSATDAPVGDRVLVVRGAPGTGGFLEGGSDDQLSDIGDPSTAAGNHGWATLAARLEDRGYVVDQVVEGDGGQPADLSPAVLGEVDVLVLGSNNAAYDPTSVDSVVDWVRSGGGLLVISDANWGTSWADAPQSDQPFLDPFDLRVNQDNGRYVVDRTDFTAPDHPVLVGVDAFDGEGVSPFTVLDVRPDADPVILAPAQGEVRRPVDDPGPLSPATTDDAALVAVTLGSGRMIGHFDRNTFFNVNGAGTDITRYDNGLLADRIVDWLARR